MPSIELRTSKYREERDKYEVTTLSMDLLDLPESYDIELETNVVMNCDKNVEVLFEGRPNIA
jgi:hypothetical protein